MKRSGYQELRATCPHCKRRVATFVPRHGDGTARYLYRHACTEGPRSWVPMPGWEVDRHHGEDTPPAPAMASHAAVLYLVLLGEETKEHMRKFVEALG